MRVARMLALFSAAALFFGLMTACGSGKNSGQTEPTSTLPDLQIPTGITVPTDLTLPVLDHTDPESAPTGTEAGEEKNEPEETVGGQPSSPVENGGDSPTPAKSESTPSKSESKPAQSSTPARDESGEDLDYDENAETDEDLH